MQFCRLFFNTSSQVESVDILSQIGNLLCVFGNSLPLLGQHPKQFLPSYRVK